MVRGLMWLPLLALFIGLAWAGWNEYRKVEAYKVWVQSFERAKYDVYAALGQQGDVLTWGVPTRQGVVETSSLDMTEVETAAIEINGEAIAPDAPLPNGRCSIGFVLHNGDRTSIPFTNADMAVEWLAFISKQWNLPCDSPSS